MKPTLEMRIVECPPCLFRKWQECEFTWKAHELQSASALHALQQPSTFSTLPTLRPTYPSSLRLEILHVVWCFTPGKRRPCFRSEILTKFAIWPFRENATKCSTKTSVSLYTPPAHIDGFAYAFQVFCGTQWTKDRRVLLIGSASNAEASARRMLRENSKSRNPLLTL